MSIIVVTGGSGRFGLTLKNLKQSIKFIFQQKSVRHIK